MDRLTEMEVSQRAPGRWQIATVTSVRAETPRAKTFRLALPMWMPFLPGQHLDVRLTAPDGYRAQRSYSIASSPLDQGEVELTIDRLDEGEVSGYFHDVVIEGDEVEVRGPFTSYFVWRGEAPALLIGGGSGVVPLMAMMRHRRRTMPELEMKLIYSARTAEELIYAHELDGDVTVALTRQAPDGWTGHTGRIDADLIAAPAKKARIVFICGSHRFVEAASRLTLAAGLNPRMIRTERFGPTG